VSFCVEVALEVLTVEISSTSFTKGYGSLRRVVFIYHREQAVQNFVFLALFMVLCIIQAEIWKYVWGGLGFSSHVIPQCASMRP